MGQEAERSRKLYLTRAVRHYGNLFTLPKYQLLVSLLLAVSLTGSIAALTIAEPSSQGALRGALFGLLVLFLPSTILDILLRTLTRPIQMLDLRRTTALSLATSLIYVLVMIAGATLQALLRLPLVLTRATLFAVCLVLGLRLLVLSAVTHLPRLKLATVATAQPLAFALLNMAFWGSWSPQLVAATLAACALLAAATLSFIRVIDGQGKRTVGIGAIPLFQGFLANWLENATSPLEDYFEELGTQADVSVSLFRFSGGKGSKAILSVPNIHPGPFRNLGSSDLPGKIQRQLEERFGAPAAVPHGMSGHELDLTSQLQLDRVLKEIQAAEPEGPSPSASRLIRVDTGAAKATCQIFGKVALLTVTCAPKSMEDIPLAIGKKIEETGRQLGLKHVAIIDAHNSISASKEMAFLSGEEEQALASAADKALKDAAREEQQLLKVGVAKRVPSEFTVGQGMGPGGIVSLAVVVGGQRALYVTVDGNNMIIGLREKILQALSGTCDECEVLTTDTHVVNAVGTMGRGYYAVGEAVDQEKLISHIREVAAEALGSVEWASASFARVQIDGVRVIGEEKLTSLTMLVDQTFRLMKWAAPLIYVPAFAVSVALFALTI